MITITLTDWEARKLRDLLEKRGNKDADLGRLHYKVHHALLRPAVKPKNHKRQPQRTALQAEDDTW